MEGLSQRILAPGIYFRVRSRGNRWLSVCNQKVILVEQPEDSCGIILLPCNNGQYMLQLVCSKNAESSLPPNSSAGAKVDHVDAITHDSGSNQWWLCKQGQILCVTQHSYEYPEEDSRFSLEIEETRYVRFCCGPKKEYLSLDSCSHLLFSTQKTGKKELFQLIEYASWAHASGLSWISEAPVRVNFKAHTGRYLCSAASVLCACAEVPCCCEEFLLDINFPPMPLPFELKDIEEIPASVELSSIKMESAIKLVEQENYAGSVEGHTFCQTGCRVRTANGMLNWSVGADGKVITVPLAEALGQETFNVHIHDLKKLPKLSISMPNHQGSCRYVSVDPSAKVTCNQFQRSAWEEFSLELANGSRILIQSVHGGFLGSNSGRTEENKLRKLCSCVMDVSKVSGWRLRAHGDSLYTLMAATTPRDSGDVYLFVDSRGKVMQSSEPAIHFPAVASLFEIKPVKTACIQNEDVEITSKSSLMGFTIRTVRKVHGKHRYLSAEPSGVLKASHVCLSRWEIFRLVDIDACAAYASPSDFLSMPAATSLNISMMNRPYQTWTSQLSLVEAARSIDYLQKAAQITAAAVKQGVSAPSRMPATLEDLCVRQICWQVSTGLFSLSAEFGDTLSSALNTDLDADNYLGIPEELFQKIMTRLCLNRHPKGSCKSLLSMFGSHNNPLSQDSRDGSQPASAAIQGSNTEGYRCRSCDYGVLQMDPTINPAHHKYLEVQYRAQSGMTQRTGFLWNLISFAGISIMSTALFLQVFNNRSRQSKRRTKQ